MIAMSVPIFAANPPSKQIRLLVVTGGHDYKVEEFNQMLSSLGKNIQYQISEFPAAFDMFLP
jgi:3-hydroxyisobutyrate dehydrogenase-like beta-hydroxyacid dehydrogenase